MRLRRDLAFATCALLLASACNRGEAPEAGRPTVALVLKTLNSPFFIDMQRGAEEAAGRMGVGIVVQAAEREVDVDKQMQIIENLIQTGVDVLRPESTCCASLRVGPRRSSPPSPRRTGRGSR
jgi:ABC-type sugar transport system substrate-binding protein